MLDDRPRKEGARDRDMAFGTQSPCAPLTGSDVRRFEAQTLKKVHDPLATECATVWRTIESHCSEAESNSGRRSRERRSPQLWADRRKALLPNRLSLKATVEVDMVELCMVGPSRPALRTPELATI
jgi:hypothetical protein